MNYEMREAIDRILHRHFPNYKPLQVDSHLHEMKVCVCEIKEKKLLGFIPWKKKIPTEEFTIVKFDYAQNVRLTYGPMNSDVVIRYGIDEINKKIYWKY